MAWASEHESPGALRRFSTSKQWLRVDGQALRSADVLAEWRRAERQALEADPGSDAPVRLREEIAGLRAHCRQLYQRALDARRWAVAAGRRRRPNPDDPAGLALAPLDRREWGDAPQQRGERLVRVIRGAPMRPAPLATPSADDSTHDAGPHQAPADRSGVPSPAGSPRWSWALLGLAGAVCFLAIYGAAVLTEPGQRVENLALLGSDLRSEVERERSLARLAPLGVVTFAIALAGAVLLGFVRARVALGLAVAGVMVLSVVLAEGLKLSLPRPQLVDGPGWLLRNSFPSGTAAVAAAIAIGLVLLVPDRLRWLGLLAGCLLIALVAHALQVTGWHRLSDVVGSSVLVLAVASVALGAMATVGMSSRSPLAAVHRAVYGLVAALAIGALAVGALMLLLFAVFPTLGAPAGSARAFHQAAFPLLGAGTSVLVVAAFARALDGWSIGRQGDGTARP